MSPADVVLSCADVSVRFGNRAVLTSVSFAVEHGSVHALIGPNGAGKTTLANVITGHARAESGTVTLNGIRLHGAPWRRARRGVGRKFQMPRVFPRASAEQNLVAADARVAWDGVGAVTWARQLGRRPAETLSHGIRQQLEWHMIVARRPHLIVLDEPTSGLSVSERELLAEQVLSHNRASQTSFLIVEHDLSFVSAVADRVSYLESGRLVTTGTFQSVTQDPRVRETYLGEYA
ncbi:ATP-binding cassette domain-containing protein [Microbacterium sp. X-17]|uniref:ABC transporter ATP-binding protein n=1 Tax=Microbacterium sp. X-17 TaxID=3144404 RepID=UPI0031F4957F